MADVHSVQIRSKNMQAIKTHDTAIEKRVAAMLTECGFIFRCQDKKLAGRPDFVIDEPGCVIFVHGCFWHRHDCYLFKLPETRTAFWQGKINSNVVRDQRHIEQLSAQNWRVLLIWECALRGKLKLNDEAICARLEEWIMAGTTNASIDHQGLHAPLP